MCRFAYFGVAASQSMGTDFGELPFQLRDEIMAGKYPDAARFLTAGRGWRRWSKSVPTTCARRPIVVTTPEGARASVQELATAKLKLIKTWVDDRRRRHQDADPRAVRRDHRRSAQEQPPRRRPRDRASSEAKELLRAGIDIFAHMISDVDDELVGAVQAASEHGRAVGARRTRGVPSTRRG